MPPIIQVLRERGLLENITDEAFAQLCDREQVRIYVGFDPTGVSLHIGSLLPIMLLTHFQRCGHRPIAVVGGGTGMIGDPSGKSAERNLMSAADVDRNLAGIRAQLARFLSFEGAAAASIVNNLDWLGKFTLIDFLRDVGKHFRLGDMLAKDSVRGRLESEAGISFTEFSYMLLQSYDFLHLFQHEGCVAQGGGADQWGNITAGCELIRRVTGKHAHGVTVPLLLAPNGEKFGKTATGTKMWLDAAMTSPYEFYQFWIRAEDSEVDKYLKFFTLLEVAEIRDIVARHADRPEARTGQKRLALEVTSLVHGREEAEKARDASEALFADSLSALSDARLRELFPEVPSVTMPRAQLEAGIAVLDVVVAGGLATSKGDARRLIAGGGLYLNNQPLDADAKEFTPRHLASESMLILRAGKKKYCLVRFE